MALALVAAALAVHVHGWFPLHQVQHLLPGPRPKFTRVYGSLEGLTGSAQPTAPPTHAVLAATEAGTHAFLHDEERIRRCVWAGAPTFTEKVAVATAMLAWLRPHKPVAHRVFSHEDGWVLALATLALDDEARA